MNPDEFLADAPGKVVRSTLGHWVYSPAPLPPVWNYGQRLAEVLSRADQSLGSLRSLGNLLPNPHLLIRPFIRREAVLSSRIEGTVTRLDQLLLYEAEPDGGRAGRRLGRGVELCGGARPRSGAARRRGAARVVAVAGNPPDFDARGPGSEHAAGAVPQLHGADRQVAVAGTGSICAAGPARCRTAHAGAGGVFAPPRRFTSGRPTRAGALSVSRRSTRSWTATVGSGGC